MKAIKRFLINLGLFPGKSLEEQLTSTLLEQKHKNFLDDIKWIRNFGDYVPDYNAKPSFSDYHLIYTENKKDLEVKWQPKTVALPKVKYKDMNEWKEAVRLEAKKLYNPTGQLNILFLD